MADERMRMSSPAADAVRWVDEHGDYLFRYVLARLGRAEVAEDLVQETFLAALGARDRFAGASSERTWLVGILKRKLIDHLRHESRRPRTARVPEGESIELLFDEPGGWKVKPGKWPADPTSQLENKEFWSAFRDCMKKLPRRLASAFTLRVLEEEDAREVCKVLDISANNLWVMLHRARLGLARCLEVNWFGDDT